MLHVTNEVRRELVVVWQYGSKWNSRVQGETRDVTLLRNQGPARSQMDGTVKEGDMYARGAITFLQIGPVE